MNKAFSSIRDCQVRLTFTNGNSVSTVWGFGTYTDNQFPRIDEWDMTKDSEFSKFGLFHQTKESTTAECMYKCDADTQSDVDRRFPGEDNPLGNLDIGQWIDLIYILSGKGRV